MRMFKFFAFAALLAMVPMANAQDVRMLSWQGFLQGVEFHQIAANTWEFTSAQRPLHEYVAVTLPAGTLHLTGFYPLKTTVDQGFYLITTDANPTMAIRTDDGKDSVRSVHVRMLFMCYKASASACQADASAYLRNGVEVQSLGAGNSGYEHSSMVPDGLIFSFLMDPQVKFH